MSAPTPPPGWYPDPAGIPRQRYWDGTQWAPVPEPPKHAGNSSGVKALLLVGAIAVVAVLAIVGSGDDNKAANSSAGGGASTAAGAAPKNSAPAPAGSSVRDGKFEFRVLGTRRAPVAGDPSNQFMTVPAQGEFVIVTLSVSNIGAEPQSFFGQNQKLIDFAGREYAPNSSADMWTNGGTGEINPGNAIQAELAFDVPPGTRVASLQLHDSMLSGGARLGVAG